MTYTYAILDISQDAYNEIAEKLRAAGYDQQFHKDGDEEVIDMHGIAVRAIKTEASNVSPLESILREMENAYSTEKFSPLSVEESRAVRDQFPNFIPRCNAHQGRHLVKMLRDKLKGRK